MTNFPFGCTSSSRLIEHDRAVIQKCVMRSIAKTLDYESDFRRFKETGAHPNVKAANTNRLEESSGVESQLGRRGQLIANRCSLLSSYSSSVTVSSRFKPRAINLSIVFGAISRQL